MTTEKIRIPDFGDVQKITVVEVFVAAGDNVEEETPLVALESEKAVMDLPSPLAGVVKEVLVKADDEVKSGDVIAVIETAGAAEPEKTVPEPAVAKKTPEDVSAAEEVPVAEQAREAEPEAEPKPPEQAPDGAKDVTFHATPSVRAFAREHDVDLGRVKGTGPHGRIQKEDVQAVLEGKGKERAPTGAGEFPSPAPPLEDFGKYGPVEEIALSRIKKMSGPHLLRSWLAIPHVTHFDEADITELEKFRKELNSGLRGEVSYSPLIFVIKAVAANLKLFPLCNSSLHPDGDRVIHKKYCHLGIAVDTREGLVVPVIKDVDRKGLREIADDLQRLSGAAREGKMAIPDIQGATFTISSLGGIGGTGFAPIVSHPQVAILGVLRSYLKPVWDGERFIPRLTLPFSLSYDHRVIDGAEAARFCRSLSGKLEDLRRTLL